MKPADPKVSIIIPVYNGSNYLKDAIDSALAQTYKNIEIIVVNDGSNDKGATEKIAKSYGDKITYYKKENGGVATALNLGIKKMTGEYFSWLSHDDMYYPDKVEKQINFLDKVENKKIFLYSNYSILRGKDTTRIINNHEMLLRKTKYSLLRGSVNGITVLIPKSIFDEMGEFDPSLRCTQDYDYWRRIQKKYDFIHMEDVLSITRLHAKQDSNVSPRVIEEGDELWIDMVKKMPDHEKVQYENTLYNFYYEMVKFLEATPYTGTLDYCRTILANLEREYSKKPITFKVSVVIPFYNRSEITIRALMSALKQSYKNLEVILVNDGSTEDISSLRNIVKKHKNTKLIEIEKNAGPAVARNKGIQESSGEYIAFLDSDDEFLENKIERQLAEMVRHNLNMSYTTYIKRDNKSETIMRTPTLTGIVVPQIISNNAIATPTVIVSKKLLTDNNISFNEEIKISEDTCFWLEIAKYSEILLIDEPLTVVNVDSMSHAYSADKKNTGMKNLLKYLLNDDYYSNFDYNISVVCDSFHTLNKKILFKRYHGDPGASTVNQTILRKFVSQTLPYRVTRRIYLDGPKGLVKAVKKRISK